MRKQKLQIRHNLIFKLSSLLYVSFTLSPFLFTCSLPSEAVLQWESVEEPIPLCDQTLATLKYA